MRYRITRRVIIALLGVIGIICISRRSAVADNPDPRYYVSTVTLTGPPTVAAIETSPTASSTYTVNITVARNGAALNVGVDGTAKLIAGNTVLGSKTFTVLRNENTSTVTFNLSCAAGVILGSSGQGALPIVARVNETDSAPLTVTCAPGAKPKGGC